MTIPFSGFWQSHSLAVQFEGIAIRILATVPYGCTDTFYQFVVAGPLGGADCFEIAGKPQGLAFLIGGGIYADAKQRQRTTLLLSSWPTVKLRR